MSKSAWAALYRKLEDAQPCLQQGLDRTRYQACTFLVVGVGVRTMMGKFESVWSCTLTQTQVLTLTCDYSRQRKAHWCCYVMFSHPSMEFLSLKVSVSSAVSMVRGCPNVDHHVCWNITDIRCQSD